jgi:flagellar protein FlaF
MAQVRYREVQRDSPRVARSNEREALTKLVTLLDVGIEHGPGSVQASEALTLLNAVWAQLIGDLGSANNALDFELRARLVSIGVFLLREAEAARRGRVDSLQAVRDITETLAEGLA